tara:strand:+ start:1322 stop:1885 length:564 start_codon:yes stop_codon:yes gene_type:complete
MKPNIILLGVGHSGTTVVTKMLFKLGWQCNDANSKFAECDECQKVNDLAAGTTDLFDDTGYFDYERAMRSIARLQQPWVIKDPRFIFTLQNWRTVFPSVELNLPLVIWLTRDIKRVERSYINRGILLDNVNQLVKDENKLGEPGLFGLTIKELYGLAEKQFLRWEGSKMRLEYEKVREAVKLFDVKR